MTNSTDEKLDILRKVEDEYRKERAEAQTLLGRAEAFNFMKIFLEFSELKTIERIKETKAYKNLQMLNKKTGEYIQIDTFKEFCDCLGVSYDTINNHLNYLRDLGEPLYKESVRLGLTNKEMRRLRTLPDKTLIDIAKLDFSEDEDKSRLVEKLAEAEKMVEKLSDTVEEQAEELNETKQQLEETRENYYAQERFIQNKNDHIDRISSDLAKAQRLIETMTPDEEGAKLREEAATLSYQAEAILRGKVYAAFKALTEHSERTGIDHKQFMSGMLAEYQLILSELKTEFQINDTPSDSDLPEWAREDYNGVELDERMESILDAEILG